MTPDDIIIVTDNDVTHKVIKRDAITFFVGRPDGVPWELLGTRYKFECGISIDRVDSEIDGDMRFSQGTPVTCTSCGA